MNNLVLSEKRKRLSFLTGLVPAIRREKAELSPVQELNKFSLTELKQFNNSVNKEEVRVLALASSITAIAAKLSKIDGTTNISEINAFKRVYRLPDINSDYNVMFSEALADKINFEHYATRILIYSSGDNTFIKDFFDSSFMFAAADGEIKIEEIIFLKKLSDIFGFSDEYFYEKVRNFMIPPVLDPYIVFSLRPNFSDKDLRKAYKEVVREYHPQRFASLISMPKIISIANERMECINNLFKAAKTLIK